MFNTIGTDSVDRFLALHAAFCREDPYILRFEKKSFLEKYGLMLQRGEVVIRVLFEEAGDIGFTFLQRLQPVGWIRLVFVLPKHRSMLHYQLLLEDALQRFGEWKVSQVRHICPEEPLERMSAFSELGFELEREHIQMEMPLLTILPVVPSLEIQSFQDVGDVQQLLDWIESCSDRKGLYSEEDVVRFVEEGDELVFVGYDQGQPVGFMVAAINERRNAQENRCIIYIEQMGVAPAFRQRGYATQLMDIAFRLGMERGAESARLHVFHDNDAAYRLYQKLGFIEVKRIHHWRKGMTE